MHIICGAQRAGQRSRAFRRIITEYLYHNRIATGCCRIRGASLLMASVDGKRAQRPVTVTRSIYVEAWRTVLEDHNQAIVEKRNGAPCRIDLATVV